MSKQNTASNLKICQMIDQDHRPTEVGRMYGKSKSRVSHITEANWNVYQFLKNAYREIFGDKEKPDIVGFWLTLIKNLKKKEVVK